MTHEPIARRVDRLLRCYKTLFLDGARYASVRNPADLALLRALGVEGEVFPDLVWRAGSPAPRHRPPGDRLRIGLDVYLANLADRRGAWTFCEKKTQLFLHTSGLGAMDFGHGRILDFARTLARRDRLDAFLAGYPFPDSAGLFQASGGHLQQLVNIVHAVRGSTVPKCDQAVADAS